MKTYGSDLCARCGENMVKLSGTQKYCKPCQPIADSERKNESLKRIRLANGAIKIGTVLSCSDCGSPFTFKHGSQKRCQTCAKIVRRIAARKYQSNNPTKVKQWAKKSSENWKMGGNRKVVLARDNHTCQKCGKHPVSVVHHIDCFGEKSGAPNNSDSNLVTLCTSCHAGIHALIDRLTRERHQNTILEAYAIFDHSHWRPQA